MNVNSLRLGLRVLIIVVYLVAGVGHLLKTDEFALIVPPYVPFPKEVVTVTGVCEIFGAVGLCAPQVRWLSGLMLALYAVCVWPANIYQALAHVHVPALPDSWWYHGPRLAFQPIFIWWALFAGGVVDWPFKSHK